MSMGADLCLCLCLGSLHPGGSLSRGVSAQGVFVQGISVQGGLCPPYGNERAVRILLECILVLILILLTLVEFFDLEFNFIPQHPNKDRY